MAYYIDYTDTSGLNLYALVFEANQTIALGLRFNIDKEFNYFGGFVETTGYSIELTESSERPGSYFSPDLLSASGMFAARNLNIEIWEQLDIEPNIAVDLFKAKKNIIWNGEVPMISFVPRQLHTNCDGHYFYNDTIYISNYLTNSFGVIVRGETANINYEIRNPTSVVVNTGSFSPSNIWELSIIASGSNYIPGTYTFMASGTHNNNFVYTSAKFVLNDNIIDWSDNNVLELLGYATGFINDGSATTTSFATTLSSSNNDHYNGQILRFTSGSLIGQGRIISDYIGATKIVTVNKAFSAAPANNTPFVIYPIGGELGVS